MTFTAKESLLSQQCIILKELVNFILSYNFTLGVKFYTGGHIRTSLELIDTSVELIGLL